MKISGNCIPRPHRGDEKSKSTPWGQSPRPLFSFTIFFLRFLILFLLVDPVLAGHGISLDGNLKYPAGFSGFDYTSPRAVVGGELTLHEVGGFDKMNPFTLKGTAPSHLGSLLFESLMVQSKDEPFAQYGLLLQDIEVAPDQLSVRGSLHPEARFSNGQKITADDVQFSLKLLKSDKAHPLYASYFKDLTEVETVSPGEVRFHFARLNRELPLILGELPILSKEYFQTHPFDDNTMEVPLGSGPYLVEKFDAGKTITFKRNPDYWGWKVPVNRGMYNFERITVKYFKDPVVALEGFKAGEFDFIFENNSKQWARDYQGTRFDRGEIIKETLPHQNGTGMQGFVFNLRRPIFQDIRVRQAMVLAFDFEWSNKNLFHGQYVRSNSYFSNSELAAQGKPSPEERELLEPLKNLIEPSVLGEAPTPPTTTGPEGIRGNLRQAVALLSQAGWKLGKDRILVNPQGQRFEVEMLLSSTAFERVMAPYAANLEKLGIRLNYRTVDATLYQRRTDHFDFDMVVGVFGQSQSPGNEQRDMWHSQSADVPGSRNIMGLKNPAVDALVEKIIYATDRKALVTACHALDRVLLAGHYLVPNWHLNYHRIAYWDRFARPEHPPLYYTPGGWLMSWWLKQK
ncbi:MAG: ABC transporter substrate-binding protein [Magnetococcales bacterium]|nr:ABC transporter substrate-binding protein [Magnetococcales bacterium]